MNKILVTILMVGVLALAATSVAFAQGIGGGHGPMMTNGEGPLHDYMIKAYADALKMTPDALETRLDNGETVYQVAASQGVPADQIPTLLADARSKALDAAVAAGAITADQASWMKSRGFGQGGYGSGTCDGTGQQLGRGMMRGGGRWSQSNP